MGCHSPLQGDNNYNTVHGKGDGGGILWNEIGLSDLMLASERREGNPAK